MLGTTHGSGMPKPKHANTQKTGHRLHHTLYVRILDNTFQELERIAEEEQTTVSSVARRLILQALRNQR